MYVYSMYVCTYIMIYTIYILHIYINTYSMLQYIHTNKTKPYLVKQLSQVSKPKMHHSKIRQVANNSQSIPNNTIKATIAFTIDPLPTIRHLL